MEMIGFEKLLLMYKNNCGEKVLFFTNQKHIYTKNSINQMNSANCRAYVLLWGQSLVKSWINKYTNVIKNLVSLANIVRRFRQ